jgi:hypothetical protein
MFSFENDPYIETVSSASEFLGDTLNIRNNDWPWYMISEEGWLYLDSFIMEPANSCGYLLSIRSCVRLSLLDPSDPDT